MSDPDARPSSPAGNVLASDRAPAADSAGHIIEPCIYVRDHTHKQYILPYRIGKEWTQFKAFLEEIYTGRGDGESLDYIRDDKFDVEVGTSNGYAVVLPSLWSAVVIPKTFVSIAFWLDSNLVRTGRSIRHIRARDRAVEFANAEVDADEDEWWSSDVSRRRYSQIDDVVPPPSETKMKEDSVDEEDEEEVTTEEDEEEGSEPPPAPKPVRVPITPTDQDGNQLAFTVDMRWIGFHQNVGRRPGSISDTSKQPHGGREMNAETYKITKAVTVTTEGKTVVKVYTLPGPESSANSSSIGIRWHHIHAEQLDWAQFKSTCLNVLGLSERLKKVITKTLMRVEKEKLKPFLGGMFIEPGTILRGDETSSSEPSSVIFSCIPYFDIRKPLGTTAAQSDRLHPPRTLMQSYYPYEPVRERDEEQAFKIFGNARDDSCVHVPSMWMLNIRSDIVVTAGYRPLSDEFVKSIEVLQEDLKKLGASIKDNTLTTLRLTDWGGRVLLYKLDEIRTYFEMEQKLRELKFLPGNSRSEPGLRLAWKTEGGNKAITPGDWPHVLHQTNSLFIDLSVIDEEKAKDINGETPLQNLQQMQATVFPEGSVPPFFHWPNAIKGEESSPSFVTADTQRSLRCLDIVDKAMKSESLVQYETTGPVDETFTSANYYESLATDTVENVQTSLLFGARDRSSSKAGSSYNTLHQTIVESQRIGLDDKTKDFVSIVHETLKLFVSDVNHTPMLRKLWGAMANIVATTGRLKNTEGCAPDAKEFIDRDWKGPITGKRTWRIRIPPSSSSDSVQNKTYFPLPESDEKLVASLKKCKRCRRETPFGNPNDALEHLRGHFRKVSSVEPHEPESTTTPTTDKLKDWIRNDDQAVLETTLAGAVTLLIEASESAGSLLNQLRELVDGVRNEDGKLSEIYTLPRNLLDTLHRLIIFYLAVERSLHFTEESFKELKSVKRNEELPYTEAGLSVLKRFGDGVRRPLAKARLDLCYMARPSNPFDYWKRLSLGPEYICAWFMRRLIVKPLYKSMTIADMYREYLSTLQFQVNHRPGKRLLRSINLLQEELTVLSEVNEWQTRLIENYRSVLDDATYPTDIPSRRALFPHERLLLDSCLENLALTREEYAEQIRRCGPLSDSTKQSAEINEEDHGKAILVFTAVTIVFLPLSFVTSFLGMNTSDIRDMNSTQKLFWEIAIPLTAGVMGTMLFIAYNGDELRDRLSSMYRTLTGKENRSTSARGISVAQRKRAARRPSDSSSTLDFKSLADEAEYATPKSDNWNETYYKVETGAGAGLVPETRLTPSAIYEPTRRKLKEAYTTQTTTYTIPTPALKSRVRPSEDYDPTPYLSQPPLRPSPTLRTYNRKSEIPTSYDYQPGYNPNAPTYMRIDRTHILPETLAFYALPWEFDPLDINYILVKRNLSPEETDMLFEHTRRLRESGVEDVAYGGGRADGGSRKRFGDNDDAGGGLGGRGEYTWVKKREKEKGRRGGRRGYEDGWNTDAAKGEYGRFVDFRRR